MIWDSHMHTSFSGDSDASPESMIKRAISLGLPGITITDHEDIDYPDDPSLFLLDFDSYRDTILGLQEKYKDRIAVRFGIEIGLQPHLAEKHQEITDSLPFDFVIGSSHVVHGMDPYYPEYFNGRKESAAYREYFESILENISAWQGFDSYGHLDYVVRYGPNQDKYYQYETYSDIIDAILKRLIDLGKALEINSAGFKYGLNHPNPTERIITRYRELGGELITTGADAHKPEHIAWDFDRVRDILLACGFRYYTVYRRRKPEFIPL